jgi:hypothetical protein
MADVQPGILALPPRLARYLSFVVAPGADPRVALRALCDAADGERTVVGLGELLARALGGSIEGLRTFPPSCRAGLRGAVDPGRAVVLAARR